MSAERRSGVVSLIVATTLVVLLPRAGWGESRLWQLEGDSYAAAGWFVGASQTAVLDERSLGLVYLGRAAQEDGREVIYAVVSRERGPLRREVVGGAAVAPPTLVGTDEGVVIAYLAKDEEMSGTRSRQKLFRVVVARETDGGTWATQKLTPAFQLVQSPRLQRDDEGNLYLFLSGRAVGEAEEKVVVWTSRDGGRSWKSPAFAGEPEGGQKEPVWFPLEGPGLVWLEGRTGDLSVVWMSLAENRAERKVLYSGVAEGRELQAVTHGKAGLIVWRIPVLRRLRLEMVVTTDGGLSWRHMVVADEPAAGGDFAAVGLADSIAVVWRAALGPRHRPLQTIRERRFAVTHGTISAPRKCCEWREPVSSFSLQADPAGKGWIAGFLREKGTVTVPRIFDDRGREVEWSLPEAGTGIVAGKGLGLKIGESCLWWVIRGADPFAPNPSLQALRGSIYVGVNCSQALAEQSADIGCGAADAEGGGPPPVGAGGVFAAGVAGDAAE